MNDTVILSLIASVPPTIAALAALFVSIKNSAKADTIIGKAVEIHTVTNSSLAKVQASLETANEKIIGLEKLVASITASNLVAASVSKDALSEAHGRKNKNPTG